MTIFLGLFFIALIISIHEAAHALSAHLLGDDTAKDFGRLTLNPLAHIDPFGTFLLPFFLLMLGLPVFGWAKPTPFNPLRLANPKRDSALIALAGPAANLLLALALAFSARLFFGNEPVVIRTIFYPLVSLNVGLAVFNLLPISPLDGFKVIGGVLPDALALSWYRLTPYGPLLLFLFLFTPGFSLLDLFVLPLYRTLLQLLF